MTQEALIQVDYRLPSGENILIRPLLESDLPALEWEGEYQHFRKLYREHYQNSLTGNTLIWVAVNKSSKVIGQVFVLLHSRQSDIADGFHRAYLFSFRIKPDYRGQGLGAFMLTHVEAHMKKMGFIILRLNVARVNPLARKFYERHGYRTIGPDPGVWSYQDDKGVWQTCREPAWKMIKQI